MPVGSVALTDVVFQKCGYRNDPKFSDRQVSANSVGPELTAPDQGIHCLPVPLHPLDTLLCGRARHYSNLRIITAIFRVSEYFGA